MDFSTPLDHQPQATLRQSRSHFRLFEKDDLLALQRQRAADIAADRSGAKHQETQTSRRLGAGWFMMSLRRLTAGRARVRSSRVSRRWISVALPPSSHRTAGLRAPL